MLILTLMGWQSQATDIYVNPNGTCGGSSPCFTTINAAINAATAGDNIYIQPGIYQEDVVINKALHLIGAGAATTIIKPATSNIGTADGKGSESGSSTNVIKALASNITISDLTVDGSNDNISGVEKTVNGITIDARNGITSYIPGYQNYDNLLLENLVIKNLYGRGVTLSTSSIRGNNTVRNCTFDNIEGNDYSIGLFCYWSAVHVSNCSFNRAYVSVNQAVAFTFQDNTCTNSSGGVAVSNGSGVSIENNTIDCRVEGSYGILIYQTGGALIKNNKVRNSTYGIVAEGSYTAATITLTGNTIDGVFGGYTDPSVKTGVYATTEVSSYDPGATLNVNFASGNTIQNVAKGVVVQASNAIRDNIEGPITGTGPVGTYTINTTINDLTFQNVSDKYIELDKVGPNSHIANIAATNMKFDNYDTNAITDCYSISDKIKDGLDDPALAGSHTEGLISFTNNTIFVTGNGTNTSAARAFDFVPAGWTIHLKGNTTYAEDVTLSETASLDHDGNTILQGLLLNGTGKTLTLAKDVSVASTLTFTQGIVTTGANQLTVLPTATVNGASDASHVKGTVTKQGNTAFVFPIGNGTYYRPLSISAPASGTDAFSAAYTGASAQSITPAGIATPGTPAMLLVSDKEYWNLQQTIGASTVNVGLNWRNTAISGVKANDADLTLAVHTASGWNNLGGAISTSGGLVWVEASTGGNDGIFALGSTAGGTTLPLLFKAFTATAKGAEVELKWSTIDDEAHTLFTVERSSDGRHYTAIGTVASRGNSANLEEYAYTDLQPLKDKAYYRIKWSNSLRTVYTDTRIIKANLTAGPASVYYAKASQAIRVELTDEWKGSRVSVVSAAGIRMYEQVITNTVTTINTQSWAPGTYIVQLKGSTTNPSATIKLTIY